MRIPDSLPTTAIDYLFAIQGISARVKYLAEKTLLNSSELPPEAELRAIIYEIISINQSVKNIVFCINNYSRSGEVNASTDTSIPNYISKQIAVITDHVQQIKACIQLHQTGDELGAICYN